MLLFIILSSQVLSTYCGMPEIQNIDRVVPNCTRYRLSPTDQCMKFEGENVSTSFELRCIDENTIEERFYNGIICNDTELTHSYQSECKLEDGCYCGASSSECDVTDVLYTNCNSSTQLYDSITYKYVMNQCLPDYRGSSSYASYFFQCNNNGEYENTYYYGNNCTGKAHSFVNPSSCPNSFGFAMSCINISTGTLETTLALETTSTLETTLALETILASKLCQKEYIINIIIVMMISLLQFYNSINQ
eukprot:334558_1